jgi:antitoxin ParD1/3/4
MPTQNVDLTSELEGFVKSEVATGHFNNASEVHRAALAELKEKRLERELRLERLRIDVQKGLDDLEGGRSQEIRNREELSSMMDGCFERAMERFERENPESIE